MKKSKTILLVVLCVALLFALVLGACNSERNSSSSPLLPTSAEDDSSSSSGSTSTDNSSAAASGAAALPDAGGSASAGAGTPLPDQNAPSTPEGDGPHSFTGTIVDAGMGKYLIEVEGGYSLQVAYADADLSGLADSRPGATVVVTYTGRLDGADTSGIKVVSIANP